MKKQLENVQQFYPDAEYINETVQKVISASEKLSLSADQVAYAVSFCSDEVNAMQFPDNGMTGPFDLGGLGGYPFNGLTGMDAFAAHIPAGGAVAIFYGPHIGITAEGRAGKINRLNQKETSNCCGSVTAALDHLLSSDIQKGDLNRPDYQQKMIEQVLLQEKERIHQSDQKNIEATEVVYEAIDEKIGELINKTEFSCENIIAVGGIFINSDKNGEACWAGRSFEVRK